MLIQKSFYTKTKSSSNVADQLLLIYCYSTIHFVYFISVHAFFNRTFNCFLLCDMSDMVLLTRDRILLGGFLCLSGFFPSDLLCFPHIFSADTIASTYDLDEALLLFIYLFILFFIFCFFLKGAATMHTYSQKFVLIFIACNKVHRFGAFSFFCSAF